MRLTGVEKRGVIRLVEGSDLSVRQTLQELGVNRATFYAWYRRYRADGDAGLTPKPPAARRYWNRIPPPVRQRVVDVALADPERSPRELAWQLTDRTGHFLSESSVYRILKALDGVHPERKSSIVLARRVRPSSARVPSLRTVFFKNWI